MHSTPGLVVPSSMFVKGIFPTNLTFLNTNYRITQAGGIAFRQDRSWTPSLRDSASKSSSPCYCPFEGRKRRVMLQVIFINSRKEKVPAAQLEEWTSLCQEPCYTEYPAKLLLLQNCCCCYKIVVVVTKLQYSKKLPVYWGLPHVNSIIIIFL